MACERDRPAASASTGVGSGAAPPYLHLRTAERLPSADAALALFPEPRRSAPRLRECLAVLAEGAPESVIAERFGGLPLTDWSAWLSQARALRYEWREQGALVLTLHPKGPRFRWSAPGEAACLSRFAYLRRGAGGWRLESPAAQCEIELTAGETLTWLFALGSATGAAALEGCGARFRELLDVAGYLDRGDDVDDSRHWEFHDRLFEHESTRTRIAEPFGATYRFAGRYPRPPENRTLAAGQAIRLPDPDERLGHGETLHTMRARRTQRGHGVAPVSLQALATLLRLSFGATAPSPAAGTGTLVPSTAAYPEQRKAYPAAGGIHALRPYLFVHRCEGLAPGAYRYDDETHALGRLPHASLSAQTPIFDASCYWGRPSDLPHAVIVLTSRFDLLAYKYEKIAYRLALLDAGCAAQMVSLVASLLGLSCCVLGAANGSYFDALRECGEIDGTPVALIAVGAPPSNE